MEKTPGQELSDLFYGLQMTVKILEGIMNEHKEGKRDQTDYESRIQSQSNLLANNLKNVKPLTEKLLGRLSVDLLIVSLRPLEVFSRL